MSIHDRPNKKQVDTSTTDSPQEEQLPNKTFGLSTLYGLQRTIKKPGREPLTRGVVLQLQRTIGNQATRRLVAAHRSKSSGSEQNTQAKREANWTTQAKKQIQRRPLTAEQLAQTLQSTQLAGDERLEQAFDNRPTLKYGARGEAVVKVQQALLDDGFELPISTEETGSPDGIFGNETREVVKAFQTKHGLVDDGKVGYNTLGKMDEFYLGSSGVSTPVPLNATPEQNRPRRLQELDVIITTVGTPRLSAPGGTWNSHGSFQWYVNYSLPEPAQGDGYIIQELRMIYENWTTGETHEQHFFEWWEVKAGQREVHDRGGTYDDRYVFGQHPAPSTHGQNRHIGIAKFYEGPCPFQSCFPETMSETRPAIWDGTGTQHDATATWDDRDGHPHINRVELVAGDNIIQLP